MFAKLLTAGLICLIVILMFQAPVFSQENEEVTPEDNIATVEDIPLPPELAKGHNFIWRFCCSSCYVSRFMSLPAPRNLTFCLALIDLWLPPSSPLFVAYSAT